MLLAFQILLMTLSALFSLYLVAETGYVTFEDKNRYLSIVLASIIALTVSFFVG